MLGHADIRFKAAARETARASGVLLPLQVRVCRPNGEQALSEAQRVVDQFRRAVEAAELPSARFTLPDFNAGDNQQAVEWIIEQKSKKEVRLVLAFSALLTFEGAADFWSRATAITRATDFLQKFSQQQHEKDVDVDAQQAKVLFEGTAKGDERAVAPAT
jgi:hypothetical protein